MSKRDSLLYIEDILESIRAINEFTFEVDFKSFCNDRKTYSATIREFIIIGEAISKIIHLLENKYPQYQWRLLKDFRNFIVNEYFGINPKIVYDASKQELETILLELKENKND